MKITDIKTFYLKEKNIDARTDSSQDALLVKIETDNGIEGWGEVDGVQDGDGEVATPVIFLVELWR